jgi:PDZ domain/Aspartyl protease
MDRIPRRHFLEGRSLRNRLRFKLPLLKRGLHEAPMRISPISCIRAAIAMLAAAPGLSQPPSQPPPSYQFASSAASLRIPVEVVADGLVFVRAKIDGHPGWFIVDNGTQGFTIDRDFASRISLQSDESATARGGGANAIQARIFHDVRIGLPGFELTHRNLVGIELKPLEPAVGHEVDGIIGSRLFDDFVVAVDYEHRLLSIYAPNEFQPSGKETAVPVRIDRHGFHYIDATIALPGAKPVTGSFLIDGGANTYADIYKPFADAHHIPPPGMKLLDEPGTSTGGTTLSRDGRADAIRVGPYSVSHVSVTFAQDVEGLMAASDYAGSIGAEFLKRFTVVFDSRGKRILLTPNGSYKDAASYDESGMRIHASGPEFHEFIVGRILPGSPAAKAGIEPGDIIESIGHRIAADITLTQLRELLRQPNASYALGVLRGSTYVRAALRSRPLL